MLQQLEFPPSPFSLLVGISFFFFFFFFFKYQQSKLSAVPPSLVVDSRMHFLHEVCERDCSSVPWAAQLMFLVS